MLSKKSHILILDNYRGHTFLLSFVKQDIITGLLSIYKSCALILENPKKRLDPTTLAVLKIKDILANIKVVLKSQYQFHQRTCFPTTSNPVLNKGSFWKNSSKERSSILHNHFFKASLQKKIYLKDKKYFQYLTLLIGQDNQSQFIY